jgi:hypothetical protein
MLQEIQYRQSVSSALVQPVSFRFLTEYKCEDDLKKLNRSSYTSAGIPNLLENIEEACSASWESPSSVPEILVGYLDEGRSEYWR